MDGNILWAPAVLSTVIVTAGTALAARLPWLKERKWAIGLEFGLLALVNAFITGNVDTPVIISTLFFVVI